MRKEKKTAIYYPKIKDTTIYVPTIKSGHQLEIVINNIPEGEPFMVKSMVSVHPEGYFYLPHLGKFDVIGMTTATLRDTIAGRLKRYFYEPEVTVTFTNLVVHVFGEFPNKNSILLTKERTSLVEILGKTGLSPLGSYKMLHILRKVGEKQQLIYYDMTKIDITDENLVVHDGDILYLMPRIPTIIKNASQPWIGLFSFVSAISSIIFLINRIK